MLSQTPLVCFIATADADRARDFYEGQLGLALVQDNGYALIFDAHGTQLRIQRVQAVAPHPYTALGWAVDDLAATVRALAACGVAMARFPGLPLGADGIWDTPDGSRVAWFQDPDGNTLSIHQPPKT
ncbi:VOC family protein [Scleromatobacter humisilvae]|uniref:VOC family protein n=1 Tax=Scleromatobacter humisilvae TaxID=2897159 RepID=A0A9X1YLB0_9BURK|nr:VOC family protein [Scleromatobacter humisilvae]MCK9686995.1 VOC family protein [Scleromatobacter humisilvae]